MSRSSVPRLKRQYVQGMNIPALRLARTLAGAKAARFPDFIAPSLATAATRPPRGSAWVHEVKYDGYRFQCHIHQGVRFFTRRGYEWSARLRNLVSALHPLAEHALVLDGEVIVQTPEGRSDFHGLEKELKVRGGSDRLVYYVFDILYLDAFDLRGAALLDRKRVLSEVLAGLEGPIKLSEHLEEDGPTVWKRACKLDLEGIVSKMRGISPTALRTGSKRRAATAIPLRL